MHRSCLHHLPLLSSIGGKRPTNNFRSVVFGVAPTIGRTHKNGASFGGEE